MLQQKVDESLELAVNFCLDELIDGTYWSGEIFANTTFTAQYIFLRQQLNLDFDAAEIKDLSRWMLSQQNNDGSWGLAPGVDGDASTSIQTYLALKILGISVEDNRMISARRCIKTKLGGLQATRMFARVFLASFGLIPWSSLPALPAELILVPKQSPINMYNLSSWARATCMPLLLVRHHQPVYKLSENNDFLSELWTEDESRNLSYGTPLWDLWKRQEFVSLFFTVADKTLCTLGKYFNSPLRTLSRKNIVTWILNRQEVSGDWAGYWPPQHNCIWALSLEGFTLDHPVMRRAFTAAGKFIRRDASGMRVQVSVSQVWDTALMTIALNDCFPSTGVRAPNKTMDWFLEHEVSSRLGDWSKLTPSLPPGGWCFEDYNTLYPDVDDSATTVIALVKNSPMLLGSGAVHRALVWILGMQNRDGGWGAFDCNNDKIYLNKIPFSDMDSLCDPSTPDVAGHIIECIGFVLHQRNEKYPLDSSLALKLHESADRAINYLLASQEVNGTWFGRWAINYIYGTSNVLCGLAYFYHDADRVDLRVAVDRAVDWMIERQNRDGGWGESVSSYHEPKAMAGVGPSTATQTAWALMALLEYIPVDHECIRKGIEYLVLTQTKSVTGGRQKATWQMVWFTATGFPGHMYLEYEYYKHYFPIMALGRYRRRVSELANEA